ncbi:MAG: hypothetical protein PVJ86_00330 [Phycisphaerales bacterium]|jgi:hypothetical protein
MTVAAVLSQLAIVEATITGVKRAHDETPESLSEFPCFINYPRRGTVTPVDACLAVHGLHTVVCELHITRQDLPTAEGVARPFIDLFVKAVWADPKLSNTCDTVNEIRYEYGRLEFGREQHLGIRFEVDFKLQESVS